MLKRLFKPKSQMVVLDNGIVDPFNDAFRQIAAVHSSGVCYVAEGYRRDDDFLLTISSNVEKGIFPPIDKYKTCTLDEIKNYYSLVGNTNSGNAPEYNATSGSQRLLMLIETAASLRASDLKIYQHETVTYVRMRIAGRELEADKPWTPEEGLKALNFAFDAADDGSGEATFKDKKFQSFSISTKKKFKLPDNVVKLRAQRGFLESDTKLGQFMVFRLFYTDDHDTGTFDDLGFDPEVYEVLAEARASLKGCVIVGGETGDGKSTTLIRTIEKLYDEHNGQVGIATLENPVEYRVKRSGVIQIPIQAGGSGDDVKQNYTSALMNFVRINPDVGVISEIRDPDAARQVLQFVSSGHATYTTLHSESANGILFRLIDWDIRPEELSQTGVIRVLMKQTLAPVLCDSCKLSSNNHELGDIEKRYLSLLGNKPENIFFRNINGCDECLGTGERSELGVLAWAGYRRQIAVGEVIVPNDEYFDFVRARDANGARKYWLKPKIDGGLGGITLQQKLTQLVLDGQLDPHDAIRRKGDFTQTVNESDLSKVRWGTGV
jgi:general secretion pathway protein E